MQFQPKFNASISDQSVEVPMASTGNFNTFKPLSISTLEIKKAVVYKITNKPMSWESGNMKNVMFKALKNRFFRNRNGGKPPSFVTNKMLIC